MSKRKNPTTPPTTTALVKVAPRTLVARVPEVLDGQIVPRAPSTDPFTVFLKSCDVRSRATMTARLNAAARILQLGSSAERYPWASLDHIAVIHVLDRLAAAKASPSTRNLTRAALRKIAKVLFGMRLLSIDERQRIDDVSPARGKRLPRGRALSSREIRELFAVCAKDETAAGRRDAALIAIMFGGGLRRDEVSKLDRADSDESGNLRVEGKGNKESLQPIVPEVVQAVRAWLAVRGKVSGEDAEALFVVIGKSGKVGKRRLDGKAIAWKVARRAAEAGIEPMPKDLRGRQHLLSPHDLRRSFVTSLLELGEDLSTVAKAARHASVATVAIYDRRDERKVAEAVAKLHVPVGR